MARDELLNAIADGEGTSDAKANKNGYSTGYDVPIAYGAYGQPEKPLSAMTLAELDKYQTRILQNPNNSYWTGSGYSPSSAAGRYQITRTTMRDLKQQLGLPDDAIFSPDLQDRLANYLIDSRTDLPALEAGQAADPYAIQNQVSSIWASVPKVSGGSTYGQPVGTSTSIIQSAIQKSAQEASSASIPSATTAANDQIGQLRSQLMPREGAPYGVSATGRPLTKEEREELERAIVEEENRAKGNTDDLGSNVINITEGSEACKATYRDQNGEQVAFDQCPKSEPNVFEVPFAPTPNRFKKFNTMTYSVSFYILGIEEYKRMMATGKKSVKDLILFMQSGGISDVPGDDSTYNFGAKRAKHFPQDFYIDNLQLKGLISGTATNSAHNVFEMNFTVTEPAGLTFLERLQAMVHDYQQELAQKRGISFDSNKVNYAAQTYLAVIRFYGYDKDGNQISGKDLETKEVLSDPAAVAEKYIPFMFTNITFRLASDKVEYSCTTICPNSMMPLDFTHARIPFNASFQGKTVKDILVGKTTDSDRGVQGLVEMLNEHQIKLQKDNKYEHRDIYEIYFEDAGIDTATVQQPGSTKLERTGFPSIDNATESLLNDRVQKNLRNYEVRSGMSITQFIDLVMRTSSYITEQYEQPIDENTGESAPANKKIKYLQWYKISTEVEALDYDKVRNDYAYKIKYVITKYKVDSVSSPYFLQFNKDCFGIHKEYNFWFTGLNTEVLDFHQDFNYLWYTSIAAKSDPKAMQENVNNLRSVQRRFYQTNSIMNDQGGENKSAEGAANAASELYSPGDQATARFQIVGDPDFICQSEIFYGPLQRLNSPYLHSPFMPDGSVNYDSSEVFFTINYNTVVDYDLSTGLADVNQENLGRDITTGKPGLSKHSFVYRANVVTSQFEGGKFTQWLEGTMMFVPPECIIEAKQEIVDRRESSERLTTSALSGRINNNARMSLESFRSDTNVVFPKESMNSIDLTSATATNLADEIVINNGSASDTPKPKLTTNLNANNEITQPDPYEESENKVNSDDGFLNTVSRNVTSAVNKVGRITKDVFANVEVTPTNIDDLTNGSG